MIFSEPKRPVMLQKDMHIKNNDYMWQLNTKFKDHEILEEHVNLLKHRNELAPYYIYNVKSNYELGPGAGRET